MPRTLVIGLQRLCAGIVVVGMGIGLLPTGSARAQAPAPSGTPWPAPTGLTVTVGPVAITNADGSFVPPEQRAYQAVAMWDLPASFPAQSLYQVELTRQRLGESAPLPWIPIGSRQASEALAGKLQVVERIPMADALGARYCFRLRTAVLAGSRAIPGSDVVGPNVEIGPWAEACSIMPPSTSGTPPLTAPPSARMHNAYLPPPPGHTDYETVARFGWKPIADSDSVYLVERAYVARDEARTATRRYEVIARVDAAAGPDGWIKYEERVPYPTMWDTPPCYRVRAVRGEERGPYSEERCALLATDQRPPEGRVPLAPDAGSGSTAGDRRSAPSSVAAVAGIAAITWGTIGVALLRRQGRRQA